MSGLKATDLSHIFRNARQISKPMDEQTNEQRQRQCQGITGKKGQNLVRVCILEQPLIKLQANQERS